MTEQQVKLEDLVDKLSDNNWLGYKVYCYLGEYSEDSEEAKDNWTGKHHQSRLKTQAWQVATLIKQLIVKELI